MPLEMLIQKVSPDTAIVVFTGSMTLGSSLKTADSQMQSLVEAGAANLILDLTSVPYADSAGLGFLVHTYGLIEERRGKLRLCGLSGISEESANKGVTMTHGSSCRAYLGAPDNG